MTLCHYEERSDEVISTVAVHNIEIASLSSFARNDGLREDRLQRSAQSSPAMAGLLAI